MFPMRTGRCARVRDSIIWTAPFGWLCAPHGQAGQSVCCLFIVNPDTVAKWNRDRFRRYWAKISQHTPGPGRPRIDAEIRRLIRTMARDGWGAPRIHGELLKLGFVVSEITVSRYMLRYPTDSDKIQRWVAFLRNHKDVIAAMDFFTVPTISLKVLYVWFVIEHGRQRVLHFNATFNPTAAWTIQQLREAFPYDTAPKYLIFDRDAIFSPCVVDTVKAMGIKPCRTGTSCARGCVWPLSFASTDAFIH